MKSILLFIIYPDLYLNDITAMMRTETNIKTTPVYAKITNQKMIQDMEILSHKSESFKKQIVEKI